MAQGRGVSPADGQPFRYSRLSKVQSREPRVESRGWVATLFFTLDSQPSTLEGLIETRAPARSSGAVRANRHRWRTRQSRSAPPPAEEGAQPSMRWARKGEATGSESPNSRRCTDLTPSVPRSPDAPRRLLPHPADTF